MPQPNLETLLRQHLTLTGEGNIIGNDNAVTIVKQTAGDYAIQIGELYLTLSHDELHRILAPAPVTISGSQVGIVGDHAHVEGGIHFHALPALLNHWRKQHPWRFYPALIFTILLILLLTITLAGTISPDFRQQLLLRGLWSRAFPKEREGQVLIVIATFDYSENIYNTQAHDEIRRAIETARDELDFANLRVQVEPTRLAADDHAGAQALGDRYDASLVIWGADTGVRVTVNFYNRKQPDFYAADVQLTETARTQIANPSAYAEFITQDLPNQLTFLSLFALGQSYYTQAEYEKSAQVIEKAVAKLGQEPKVEGAAEAYFRLGWLYQELLEDLEQVIANYDRVIDLNPNFAAAYNNRGNAYYALQDYQRAIADYDRAIDLNPQLAQAYNNRGTAYSDLQDYERAIADYDRAIELNPQYAAAHSNRGLAYYDLQDYQRAIADYDRAIELNPELAQAHYNRGLTYSALQDYQRAIADYDRAIELNPQYAAAHSNRGTSYSALQDYERAIADYDRAIELNPQYAAAHYNRGNAYSALQDYERAIADYDRAIDLNPQFAYAYNNRGLVYQALQDYQRAIADFDRAIDLNPQYAKAYNNRGLTYSDLQDYQRAIADYKRAIELNPQYAAAHSNRGTAYYALQDYERAIADYDRAIELNPQDAKAYYNRGIVYYDLQDYQHAIADYDRAIDLNPQDAEAYYNRGNAHAHLQDYQRAIADYDRAIDLNPQDAEAYNNRGIAYSDLQDYQRAIEDYTHAAELMPHPLIYYNLARVHALQNQPADACPWLEKAIALDIQYRDSARTEPDFNPIRAAPCFQALMNDE